MPETNACPWLPQNRVSAGGTHLFTQIVPRLSYQAVAGVRVFAQIPDSNAPYCWYAHRSTPPAPNTRQEGIVPDCGAQGR